MSQKPPQEWTVLSMLDWATAYFAEKKIPSPRLSIEWLLAHILKLKRLDLYLNYDRPLEKGELEKLRDGVKRRAQHEPLQYIIGETDFYSITVQVNKHVLIPRPETEELVESILSLYSNEVPLKVLDIGTGSGCIPLVLKKERPSWDVTGVDISPEALDVARSNAKLNELDVRFELGNLFADSILEGEKFDIIVSNPPYIAPSEADYMDVQVKKYEPSLALFIDNPKSVYESIEQISRLQLRQSDTPNLFLEINESLGQELVACFSTDYWISALKKDLSGRDRMIICNLRCK